MKEKLNATVEVVHLTFNDFITSSGDHDNGYADSGSFMSFIVDDIKNLLK